MPVGSALGRSAPTLNSDEGDLTQRLEREIVRLRRRMRVLSLAYIVLALVILFLLLR